MYLLFGLNLGIDACSIILIACTFQFWQFLYISDDCLFCMDILLTSKFKLQYANHAFSIAEYLLMV